LRAGAKQCTGDGDQRHRATTLLIKIRAQHNPQVKALHDQAI
jgi:hypothetical protein